MTVQTGECLHRLASEQLFPEAPSEVQALLSRLMEARPKAISASAAMRSHRNSSHPEIKRASLKLRSYSIEAAIICSGAGFWKPQ